jgi:NADH dehydrogenase FAD-containing subunit
LASVRAVIPGQIRDEEIFHPIEPGFKSYPAGSVDFIVGAATKLDTESKTVTVSTATDPSRRITYDYLVVATGSRAESGVPWKASSTYEACLEDLHATAETIGAASSIVVAGAGPTGVELAAEIKWEYGDKKEVTLLSVGGEIVGGDATAVTIEKELQKLRVVVKKNVQASSFEKLPDGRTEVSLSNGETLTTDLYLPATGLMANTEFLPIDCLNERKYVLVDSHFRIRSLKDAWAVGDVVARARSTFVEADVQVSTRRKMSNCV